MDLYDDAVSGALYKSPHEKEETKSAAPGGTPSRLPGPEAGSTVGGSLQMNRQVNSQVNWLDAMRDSAARALDIPESRVFLKERKRMGHRRETESQYSRISEKNFYRDAREGDLIFRVNLSDYLDTGLFLDARKKRAIIRTEAMGKRVLNLFAYTCSLSVSAAKGGARLVDSVDLSNTYLEWGRINFALNGMEAGYLNAAGETGREGALNLIRSDVMEFLTNAARRRKRWDMIILDPPGFSNSKKMKGILDIRRDHQTLIRSCLSLLSPGGTLWFSSNARGFSLEGNDFPDYTLKDMRPALVDEDFKGKRIPLCYTLQRR